MKNLIILLLFVSFAAQGQNAPNASYATFHENVLTVGSGALSVRYNVIGEEYQQQMLDYYWPVVSNGNEVMPGSSIYFRPTTDLVPYVANTSETWRGYFRELQVNRNGTSTGKRVMINNQLSEIALLAVIDQWTRFRIIAWGINLGNISPTDEVRIQRFGDNSQYHFAVDDVSGVFNR